MLTCDRCLRGEHRRCRRRDCACRSCGAPTKVVRKGSVYKTVPTGAPKPPRKPRKASTTPKKRKPYVPTGNRRGAPAKHTYEQGRMVPDLKSLGYSHAEVAAMLGLPSKWTVQSILRNPTKERAA